MTVTQQRVIDAFPQLAIKTNYPLAEQTYFKIGGPAEVYVEIENLKDIVSFITFCRQEQLPLTIIGGASNVIVSDDGIEGVVLKLTNDTFTVQNNARVKVGAGIKTALLVRNSIDHSFTGLEYFLGVPGNLGGAVYNNAHYLQDLIGEHISRVHILDESGSTKWLDHADCDFKYDHSRFHHTNEVILEVEFSLKKGSKEKSQQLIQEATLYRANTQPLGAPSSGCIFQNVPMTDALAAQFPQFKERSHIGGGFLIDQAGLKGTTEGDIEVSHKHAAFFVNNGTGRSEDVKKLITRVQLAVKEKFRVELKPEVFFLGK